MHKKNNQLGVIIYGAGAMGCNMVRLLHSKPGARITGIIDKDPMLIGRDIGEVAGLNQRLGVNVVLEEDAALDQKDTDVALHATTAFADEAVPQIETLVDRKINVISICQELFFPIGMNVQLMELIDHKAKTAGVSVTATGINPGFSMDILAVLGSLPCWRIDKVTANRIVDFSPYGPDEMKHIGAGLTADAFEAGVEKGDIGHIGLLETTAMVAHCLGLQISDFSQIKAPVITQRERQTAFVKIAPGRVCGFEQSVIGKFEEKVILYFRMMGLIDPQQKQDGIILGNRIRIEGNPTVDIDIKEEIAQKGGLGTAAAAVNMIPLVIESKPGFHTMNELPLPHFWAGNQQPIQ